MKHLVKLLAVLMAMALFLLAGCDKTEVKTDDEEITVEATANSDYNAFTFRKAFPDHAFASIIAFELGKEIDDETSIEELASINKLEFTDSVALSSRRVKHLHYTT